MLLRLILIVLMCTAARADTNDPLRPLDPLVGGSWIVDGELPGGRKIRTRLVAVRGQGHVRLRVYTVVPQGEVLFYETYMFWHPTEKKLRYVTFAADGDVVWGDLTAEGNRLVFAQAAQGKYPPMRIEYVFDPNDKDVYTGRTSLQMGQEWKSLGDAQARRAAGGAEKVVHPPGKATQLSPLAPLRGGRWEARGTWSDGSQLDGYTKYAWSFPGRVLESRTFSREKDGTTRQVYLGLHYWDGKDIRVLFFGKGKVSLGTLTVTSSRWDYAWTTFAATGPTRMRETLRFKDKDTQVWTVEMEQAGQWVPLSGEMTNTRVRQ